MVRQWVYSPSNKRYPVYFLKVGYSKQNNEAKTFRPDPLGVLRGFESRVSNNNLNYFMVLVV